MTVMYILRILFMYHLPKSCILNSERYKQYPDIAKNRTSPSMPPEAIPDIGQTLAK